MDSAALAFIELLPLRILHIECFQLNTPYDLIEEV